MSWKGFKKAVNRLPHVIQSSIGQAENTVDEEFDEIYSQYKECLGLLEKLADASSKYKQATQQLFRHQHTFAVLLKEVYEPIPSKSKVALIEPTPDQKAKVDLYLETAQMVMDQLVPQIEHMVERKICQPLIDAVQMSKQIEKTLTKRNHKKLDYDRMLNQYEKQKAQLSQNPDERKLVNSQAQVDQAYNDYQQYNELLKQQLPIFMQLCQQPLMDPILKELVMFQDHLFQQTVQYLSKLKPYLSGKTARDGLEASKIRRTALIEDISILQLNKRVQSTILSPSQESLPNYASSEELSPPAVTGGMVTSSPALYPTATPPPSYATSTSRATPSGSFGAPQYPVPTFGSGQTKKAPPPMKPKPAYLSQPKPTLYRCLYDFEAQQPGDLTIREGDLIEVLEKEGEWWKGKISGRSEVGLFPSNYVQLNSQ